MFGPETDGQREPARQFPVKPDLLASADIDNQRSSIRATVAGMKFIAGEPMKPATNLLTARSQRASGAPCCSMIPWRMTPTWSANAQT